MTATTRVSERALDGESNCLPIARLLACRSSGGGGGTPTGAANGANSARACMRARLRL